MQAFTHGAVTECGDSIKRRMFFRVFTYSADYMEKYVIYFSLLHVDSLNS